MELTEHVKTIIANTVNLHIPEDGIDACNIEVVQNSAIEVIRVGICYTRTVDPIRPARISKLLMELNDALDAIGEFRGISVRHFYMHDQELEASSAC